MRQLVSLLVFVCKTPRFHGLMLTTAQAFKT